MTNKPKVYTKSYFKILPFDLKVVDCKDNSIESCIQYLIRKGESYSDLTGMKDYEDRECIACVYNTKSSTNIYLFVADDLPLDVLVHECIHITFAVFDIVGSNINEETEELFAYINQFIFNEVKDLIVDTLKVDIFNNKTK